MAGLLAWAADVVGAGGAQSNGEDDPNSIPIVFAAEQQKYVQELDQKAASLSRAIEDLRLRLLPTPTPSLPTPLSPSNSTLTRPHASRFASNFFGIFSSGSLSLVSIFMSKAILVHFCLNSGIYHVGIWILFLFQEYDYVGL